MRQLIQDPKYWQIEETHFFGVNTVLLDYHRQFDTNNRMAEVTTCPPVTVLLNLWLASYEQAKREKAAQPDGVNRPKIHTPMPQPSSSQTLPRPGLRRSERLTQLRFSNRGGAAMTSQKTGRRTSAEKALGHVHRTTKPGGIRKRTRT